MRVSAFLFIGLSIATLASVTVPTVADAAQTRRAPAVRRAAPRPLDLSVHGPSVAMQAAQAASAPAATKPAEAPTSASADTVSGLTVSPEVVRQGKVIASTDATSLTSPNFSATDAASKPLAVGLGQNAALGKQTVDNTPVAAGVSRNNPDLLGSQPTRGDVGVTTVF